MQENNLEIKSNKKYYYLFFVAVSVIFIAFCFFIYFIYHKKQQEITSAVETNKIVDEKVLLNKSLGDSLLRNQPENLQDYFLQKINNGENDKLSKAAIYFITHRYFDNGSDIYEIVDYVNAHEETKFLNEAKNIYPEIFTKIDKREKLLRTERLLVYLAYLEILKDNNLAESATYSTAAARYIELYEREQINEGKKAKDVDIYKQKAIEFATAAEPLISSFILNNGELDEEFSKDEALVGLNQFGVTLAYFKKYNINIVSKYDYIQVLEFALNYAKLNKLVLTPFTALNYDYALLVGKDLNQDSVEKVGLGKIMNSTYKNLNYKERGLIDNIINGSSRGSDLNGVYGKNTINKIMTFDLTFEDFLLKRGYKK